MSVADGFVLGFGFAAGVLAFIALVRLVVWLPGAFVGAAAAIARAFAEAFAGLLTRAWFVVLLLVAAIVSRPCSQACCS